jgi:hypothetical protein
VTSTAEPGHPRPAELRVYLLVGVLEVHGRDLGDVRRAGEAILDGLGAVSGRDHAARRDQ